MRVITMTDLKDTIVTHAADNARDTNGLRKLWVAIAAIVVGVVIAIASVVGYVIYKDNQVTQLANSLKNNYVTSKQLYTQLEDAGEVPKVEVPPVPDMPEVINGVDGINGLNGIDGTDGADGQPGVNGRNGRDSTIPGPAGTNGVNGRNGVDGQSPPCLSEPAQCRGKDGANGTNGKDGTNGTNGTDGEDGEPPKSWTWTDNSGLVPITYRCERDAEYNPDSPNYTCTEV